MQAADILESEKECSAHCGRYVKNKGYFTCDHNSSCKYFLCDKCACCERNHTLMVSRQERPTMTCSKCETEIRDASAGYGYCATCNKKYCKTHCFKFDQFQLDL